MDNIFIEDGKQYIDRPVISRDGIISRAINECLDAMFRASYPSITLDEYRKKHNELTDKELKTEQLFKAHYLPEKIYKAILEDFADAYEFKSDLPEIIATLKNYFEAPVVDAYVKDEDGTSHRGYTHPDPMPEEHRIVAEKYLDMADEFYNWNRDYNAFCFNVMNYSPCSNRETVEEWHHEHGEPDFKIPEDSYWVDGWDDEPEEEDEQ